MLHFTSVNICILSARLSRPSIMDMEPCGAEQVTSREMLGLDKMLKWTSPNILCIPMNNIQSMKYVSIVHCQAFREIRAQ